MVANWYTKIMDNKEKLAFKVYFLKFTVFVLHI